MKVIRSLLITVPALMLVTLAAHAAETPQERQAPVQQPQQYPQGNTGYYPQPGFTAQGCFGAGCMAPCPPQGCLPPPPPCCEPPPPCCMQQQNWDYYCRDPRTCAPPVLPYRPRPIVRPWPPPQVEPYYGGGRQLPPVYVAPGGSGGYFRNQSGNGCEVQQGNNGEFVVLSASGQVLFKDNSTNAEANAERVKAAYENGDTGLCGNLKPRADKIHSS